MKSFRSGALASAETAPEHGTFVTGCTSCALQKCPYCGDTFSHRPAGIVHAKFCSKRENKEGGEESELVHSTLQSPPQPAQQQDQLQDADENEEQPSEEPSCSRGGQVKVRKSDGKPKRSGLKLGQMEQAHTLLFKYRVAIEY